MTLTARPAEAMSLTHDRVYRHLRGRIMYGDLSPGHALTLRGIGKEYAVSMTPAREAVRRLVAEGALTMSTSGRISTPELSNERIEELAALRALQAEGELDGEQVDAAIRKLGINPDKPCPLTA